MNRLQLELGSEVSSGSGDETQESGGQQQVIEFVLRPIHPLRVDGYIRRKFSYEETHPTHIPSMKVKCSVKYKVINLISWIIIGIILSGQSFKQKTRKIKKRMKSICKRINSGRHRDYDD